MDLADAQSALKRPAAIGAPHQNAESDPTASPGLVQQASRKSGQVTLGCILHFVHVRIHDLRHTAAVTMLASGVPLEKVSQVLGHSNTAITFSTYGRYLPEHMTDAVNVLDFMNLKAHR